MNKPRWHHPTQETTPQSPWGRQRLLLGLTAIATLIIAALVGLGLVIAQIVRPTLDGGPPSPAGPLVPGSVRDRIAAEPMMSLPAEAATRPDPAISPAPPIRVPDAIDGRGPAGVPTFPRTPEGAVAQLAAIDVAVLEAMSVPYAGDVHDVWVLPGGPAVGDWDVAVNVAAFLRGARQGTSKDVTTLVRVVPAAGLVKGTDGPDWVLACVLLDVQASIRGDYRMGWAHCARMQWSAGRWQIGPGVPPAAAPSAWPGSRAAVAAGWLTWVSPDGEVP